jgi:hypothetical protein
MGLSLCCALAARAPSAEARPARVPARLAIASSAATAVAGAPVRFTVSVDPAAAAGTVELLVDSVTAGPPVPVAAGAASFDVTLTRAGARLVSAVFSPAPRGGYAPGRAERTQRVTAAGVASVVLAPGSSDQRAPAGGEAFAHPLALRVEDAFGNAIAFEPVVLVAPARGPGAFVAFPLVTTDVNGEVIVQAVTNGTAGTYAIAVHAGGATGAVVLTNEAGEVSAPVEDHGDPAVPRRDRFAHQQGGSDAPTGLTLAVDAG